MVKISTIALVAAFGFAANAGNVSQTSVQSFKSTASTTSGNKSQALIIGALGFSQYDKVQASFTFSEGKVSTSAQQTSEFLNESLFDSTAGAISDGANWSNTQSGKSTAAVSGQMGEVGSGSLDSAKYVSATEVSTASGLVLSNTGDGYSTASKGSVNTVYTGSKGIVATSFNWAAQKMFLSVNGVATSVAWSVNDFAADPVAGSNTLSATVWTGLNGSVESTQSIFESASVRIVDSANFTSASDYWPSAEGYESDAETGSLWVVVSLGADVTSDSAGGSVEASTKTSSDKNLTLGSLAGSNIILAAPFASAQGSSGVSMGSTRVISKGNGKIDIPKQQLPDNKATKN